MRIILGYNDRQCLIYLTTCMIFTVLRVFRESASPELDAETPVAHAINRTYISGRANEFRRIFFQHSSFPLKVQMSVDLSLSNPLARNDGEVR